MRTPDAGPSIADLFGDSIHQLSKLVHNEMQLAKAELSQKASQAAKGVAMIAGAAILAIPALVMLLISVAELLVESGMSPALAYFIVAAGGALVSGVLAFLGASWLKPEHLKPEVTLQQLDRDRQAAKDVAS